MKMRHSIARLCLALVVIVGFLTSPALAQSSLTGRETLTIQQDGYGYKVPLSQLLGGGQEIATAATGTEIIPCVQGGVTRGCSARQISTRFTQQAAGTRDGALGGGSNSNFSDGTVAGATYRVYHQSPAGTAVSDIQLCYSNWRMSQTGEVAGANAITVKAYLEYSSASYPAFFNGAQSVVIQPGATACTDPVSITLPPASTYYDRAFVTANGVGSGSWPLGRSISLTYDSNNYASAGGDVASTTGAIATSSTLSFGTSSILGKLATAVPAVGFLTDSIGAGIGDQPASSPYSGFMERGLGNSVPWISASRGSYQSAFAQPPYSRLFQLFGRGAVTTLVSELGVNDYATAGGLAAFQARKIAEWSGFTQRGIPVVQTTITPGLVTSTDGWTSLANQTPNAADAVRSGFNDWLRAGAPMLGGIATSAGTSGALIAGQAGHPLAGYVEIADAVESSRNSGKWAILPGARSVADAAISTSASQVLTSATANFTSADVGKGIFIAGAGPSGAGLSTVINVVTNSTSVLIYDVASTTVTAATLNIGSATKDGLHPVPFAHTLAAGKISAAVASGLIR